MSAQRRPTMKDVAQHAGVSVSTVSYVLNDSGPVAAERRARVLDAIRVLEYAPNESARSLKRRSASTIGLVVPDLANQFFAMLAQGVQQAASARDVLVVLCTPEATGDEEPRQLKLLRSQRLGGLIHLSGWGTSPSALLELSRSGPIVLVDEQMPGLNLPAVVCDSRTGAREIAQHVLDQGHRRVAVISGPLTLWTAQQRLAGYREALVRAGLDPDEIRVLEGDYRQDSGRRLAAEALAGDAATRPTALLCANDLMAIGALEYCKAAGLDVPGDLSLVGFDDLPFVSLLTPALTTVRQPARDMGARAVTLLFDLLENKAAGDKLEHFPTTIQFRESVGPPA